MKKLLILCSIMLGSVFGFPDSIGLDIIIRDFSQTHPDFENFDSRRYVIGQAPQCGTLPGDTLYIQQEHIDWASQVYGLDARIDLLGQVMRYGDYGDNPALGDKALLHHTDFITNAGREWKGKSWGEAVTVTRGMVQPQLAYLDPNDPLTAYPVKAAERCDNSRFEQWYAEVPGINYRVEEVLWLKKDPSSDPNRPRYYINSDSTAGYFPLDKYDGDLSVPTWGKQNLRLWCPRQDMRESNNAYEQPQDNPNLCNDYWNSLDVTTGYSPVIAANPKYARNYNFTMMGYTEFTYYGGEVFSFAGDDDMWIFINNQLVSDLGGTHHPSEVIVSMDQVAAAQGGWEPGTAQKLHFFYADRQTDGSNLRIYTTMNEVSTPTFGAPAIQKAVILDGNSGTMNIYSTTELSQQTLDQINAGVWNNYTMPGDSIVGPFVLLSSWQSKEVPFVVTSIQPQPLDEAEVAREGRYKYVITFPIGEGSYIPTGGDSIAFRPVNEALVPAEYPRISSTGGRVVTELKWEKIEAKGSPGDIFKPVPRPEKPNKLDFTESANILNGSGNMPALPVSGGERSPYFPSGVTGTVQPIANPVDYDGSPEGFPADKTGELIFTALPRSELVSSEKGVGGWTPEYLATYGGFPPASGTGYGLVNSDVVTGGDAGSAQSTQFIKSGWYGDVASDGNIYVPTNGSTPAFCTGANGVNSCLTGLSFTTEQGFKLNVMVYDANGNFVSRYFQEVSNTEVAMMQAKTDGTGDNGVGNPKLLVDLGIYPRASNGRALGNGVYIMVVDFLKILRKANCNVAGESDCFPLRYLNAQNGATNPEKPAGRQQLVLKVGYMRPATK
jgi:fibro-slime domain-containing protein